MFANGSDGYAYGTDANVLFWTRDGGLTWQRVQLGDPLAAPIATAGGRAYALTYGCPRRKGEVCLSVDLASSPVDRNDWTQARNRFVFKLTSDAQSVSIAAFGAKVWFVLASEGRCPSCGVSVSQNYGRTFSALPREQFWGWWGTTTTATSDQTLWLTAYGVHNSANLRSTDGGKRFVSIPAGNSFSNPFSSLIPLSDQEAVLFFYSAYSRWSVRVTTDGGQRFKTVFGPTNAVNAIAVANSKDWLVSGDSVLWRTTNGGVAWQSIEPPRV
jgi:hypothetical protein